MKTIRIHIERSNTLASKEDSNKSNNMAAVFNCIESDGADYCLLPVACMYLNAVSWR